MLIDTPAITDLAIDLHTLTLSNGGATIHPETGEQPTRGYVVSVPGAELTIRPAVFTANTLRGWIKREAVPILGTVEHGGHTGYLGCRHDKQNGAYIADVSIVVEHLTEALDLGRRFRQRAIFDIEGGKSIDIPREPSDN